MWTKQCKRQPNKSISFIYKTQTKMKEYKKKICAFRKISRAAKDLNVGGEHLHICLFDIYILNAKSVFFLAISFILSLNTKYRWFPLHFAPVDRIFYFRFITTVSLFLWPLNWIRITRKLYNFKDLCANVMWLVIFLLKFLRFVFSISLIAAQSLLIVDSVQLQFHC